VQIPKTVPSGKLSVIGTSGGGKSTLRRRIAGLEHLAEGRIMIGDRNVRGLCP